MGGADSSEMIVSTNETTQFHDQECDSLNSHHSEYVKCNISDF
jgi:hypothetical protein